ncbi:type II toxin-antitoxin system VapC family toxin [Mumia sp. Pv 4-285]|uniref:type II toxin-antitoxin system VapC family toxin n=1 Tax=Mumia qirimensis TaxID=3234852 RepID=UPI00351CD09B
MIVLDASVWVPALADDSALGESCRDVLAQDPDWVAPAHGPVEALRTIRRYRAVGAVSEELADLCAAAIWGAEVLYVGPEPWVLRQTWELRHNLNPYDAPYVAVARSMAIPLVTRDVRMARAADALGVQTVVP